MKSLTNLKDQDEAPIDPVIIQLAEEHLKTLTVQPHAIYGACGEVVFEWQLPNEVIERRFIGLDGIEKMITFPNSPAIFSNVLSRNV